LDQVKMSKEVLLGAVKENKERHVALYNEAVTDYKTKSLELLAVKQKEFKATADALKKKVENSDKPVLLTLPHSLLNVSEVKFPTSHEKDYDKIIRMLELSVDEQITLSDQDFEQYVLDQWSWKGEFETVFSSNKLYGVSSK
jgi:hypothetical protein